MKNELIEALERLEVKTGQLTGRIDNEREARLRRDEAKRTLAEREADMTRAGLEGSNAAERKANLEAATFAERRILEQAEDDLIDAQADLRIAETLHQLARYRVQSWQVLARGENA